VTQSVTTSIRRLVGHRFVRDTAILQVGQFALIAVQALTNILLIRILGTELLGVYTLSVTLANIVGFLDLSGSGRVVLNQLSRAIGSENVEDMRDILAYFLRINLQINVPLVVIFLVSAPVVAEALYHRLDISLFARWLILERLLDIPINLVGIAYQSRGDMRRLVVFETSKVVMTSGCAIGILLLGGAVHGIILTTLSINLAYTLVSLVLWRQLARSDPRFPSWGELLKRLPQVKIRRWFGLGFTIALQKNLDALTENVLVLLLGTMGTDFVGRISVALKVITLPQPLITGIARNLDSFLPRRVGKDDSSLLAIFTKATLYTGAVWSIVTLAMAVIGPILLFILFPRQLDVVPLLYPLLIQSLAIGFGVGIGPTMRTIGRVEFLIMVHILVIALTIPVGTWLINSLGLYGAAWLIGVQQSFETGLMIAIVFWLLRRQKRQLASV
jgi:O-antigen/teichoic acid export membrane protein